MLAFYIDNRQRFFGLNALYLVFVWLIPTLTGSGDPLGEHLLNAGSVASLLVLASTSRLIVHVLLTLLSAAGFLAFLVIYYLQIA